MGTDFKAIYAFNYKLKKATGHVEEEEQSDLALLGQKYGTMAKKLDLSRMVSK